jgi:hypothetical protein
MFEPFIDSRVQHDTDPQQIVAEAKRNFEILVRIYYLRHGFDAMDLFLVVPLMLIGYDCVEAIKEATSHEEMEPLRATLMLVAHGLYTQRRNHYLAEALFCVLRGRMRSSERSLLNNSTSLDQREADARQEMVQMVRSRWPVIVVKRIEEKESHVLSNLVESYAHLGLQELS